MSVPTPAMSEDDSLTVTVLNRSADPSVDATRWCELVRDVLLAEGVVGPAETTVVFVDAAEMAALNAEHMGGSGPTDVLSFPIDDDPTAPGDSSGVRFVGDIVVCGEVARANAADHAGTDDDEIALLLVHGTLHLLGHDHADVDERAVMWAAERRHLERSWRLPARDPWVSS